MVRKLIKTIKTKLGGNKKSTGNNDNISVKESSCPIIQDGTASVWEPSRKRKQSERRSTKKTEHRKNVPRKKGTKDNKSRKSPSSSEPRKKTKEKWDISSFKVDAVEGEVRFHDFDLPPEIMHAVSDLGFQYCTPIQAQTLAFALNGRDVMGKAQTGTGKTAAFLIAALTRILRNPVSGERKCGTPRVLVIAPTRELVIQIGRDADALGKYCKSRCVAVYGGMDYQKQQNQIKSKIIDIVAATPGRLLDFRNRRDIDLSKVEILIIDEADRMLDMGFIPDVRRIVGSLPRKDKRQTMFYSATLNDTVRRLAEQWTKNPENVDIAPKEVAVNTVEQTVFLLSAVDKFNVLYNILQNEKPTRVLVFCNRRDSSQRLADGLQSRNITCSLLSGSVNQKTRLRTLDDFRAGKIKLVIATDVAGRGIHVDGIDLVVNYDIPYEPEDYVHRIGRTGRAGASGRAYTFACEEEAFTLPDIEEYIGKSLSYKQVDESLLQPAPAPTVKVKRRTDAKNNRSSGNRKGGSQRSSSRGSARYQKKRGTSHKHRGSGHRNPEPHHK